MEQAALQVTKDPWRRSEFGTLSYRDYSRNFRAGTQRSTMPKYCAFRGGIRGWVNVSPNQDGETLRAPRG